MLRTQIYLTEEEQSALRMIANLEGTTQSEMIRKAIDKFIATYQKSNRVQLLQAARGIWTDREVDDFLAIRAEWERTFGE